MVDRSKVVMPLFILDYIPRAGSNDCVEIPVLHLLPHPNALHIAFRGTCGVMKLSRQHQERLSVNLEMSNPVLLDQSRFYRSVSALLRAACNH